jgi:signal transduction histidine kinase
LVGAGTGNAERGVLARPASGPTHRALQAGGRFAVQWSVTPILGRAGDVRSYVCVGRDVTREEQIECGLRENDKLRAVAVLAGGIAHDFNNLLGSILGLAELCEIEAPPGTRLARNSGRIGLAAGKAATLVRQLLDFSRQTPATLEPTRISELIAHAGGLLRAALPPDVTLSTTVAEDSTVRIDLVQMEQVLLNLTRNAAQAMGNRGGEIRIVVDRAEPGRGHAAVGAMANARHARLRVADNGEGIAPEAMPKIFEPFFTTKPVGEGAGLGLAAVHGIIGSHDGVIEVASEAGTGTTFSLYLPLAGPTEPPDKAMASAGHATSAHVGGAVRSV